MLESVLHEWTKIVLRFSKTVLGLLVLATLIFGWIATTQFRMNSNLSDLIHQTGTWRDDFDHFKSSFPDLIDTALVVVTSKSQKHVESATQSLEHALALNNDRFRAVYAPQNDPFFRRHALLYLDPGELDDMADRLAEAQPVLTSVAQDPSLRGIIELVANGVENDPDTGFDTILRLLTNSAKALIDGSDPRIYWTDEFFKSNGDIRRIIFLKAQALDFDEALPNATVIAEIRSIIESLNFPPEVTVAITGEIALSHEEIEAAITGVQLTGWIAIVLLAIVLVYGVRSAKIIVAIFLLLICGIIWTSAYAMTAVGEYNTLSIVFLVMFFGLGVDFAIHYSLSYQESTNKDMTPTRAVHSATTNVGRAIAICSVTTTLGFLGFWPTDYQGLADLGIISAGGMLIACFLTFTFLPAFFKVVGRPRSQNMDLPNGERIVEWLVLKRRQVVFFLLTLTLGAIYLSTAAQFDYSVMALRDPDSESMRTHQLLQEDGLATDYALSILSEDIFDKSLLTNLATVKSVRTPADYVPKEQNDKLWILEDLQELLWSAIEPGETKEPPSISELRSNLQKLRTTLDTEIPFSAHYQSEFEALRDVIIPITNGTDDQLIYWQQSVVENLIEELNWLREAVQVTSVDFNDLPEKLIDRLVSTRGELLSTVLPSQDTTDVDALNAFIRSVRNHVPIATGRPVIEWGVGNIVLDSFLEALAFAITGIFVVLVITFRQLKKAALILVPLALASTFTLALGVVFNWPLNMANILVIPLIFGLGVDNGIHIVDRYTGTSNVGALMHSSTPRAVILSTLTTIGTFAALSLSPHEGTASIGSLLTVAVAFLLVFTVFLLPVLLSFLNPQKI